MYVVTFYSYKGGVGRTMALMNVAVSLAKAGKRVLVVDFDLEAPGLTSFDALAPGRGHRGIVDYIEAYRTEFRAPDVADYIVRCESEDLTLWLMTAGDNAAPGYTERLNAIDWERLYNDEDGYLLMEDLRSQWSEYEREGFDYVFVDSRTGHTDVGGICTRQLPDAVTVMFVPNDQNVDGLVPIVKGIRANGAGSPRKIQLLFCPSNIPDEYDENEILDKLLRTASRKLGYQKRIGIDQPASMIHHRTSLELLTEPVVVIRKERSLLAKEYLSLRQAIEALNIADRDGADIALRRLPAKYHAARLIGNSDVLNTLVRNASEILTRHPRDAEIAMLAGDVFQLANEFELDFAARTQAIEQGDRSARAYLTRAVSRLNTRREGAETDLMEVLKSPAGSAFEFGPAIQLLFANDAAQAIHMAEDLFRSRSVPLGAKKLLVRQLMMERDRLAMVVDECMRLADEADTSRDDKIEFLSTATIAMIGDHRYSDAAAICDRIDLMVPDRSGRLVTSFNRAIAAWGEQGVLPKEAFEMSNQLITAGTFNDANAHQCFAIARAAVGRLEEAASEIELARRRVVPGRPTFSCWRFLYVDVEEFSQDLDEMSTVLETGSVPVPPFLSH